MDVLSLPSDRALLIPIVKFEQNTICVLEKHSLIGTSVSAYSASHLSLMVHNDYISLPPS